MPGESYHRRFIPLFVWRLLRVHSTGISMKWRAWGGGGGVMGVCGTQRENRLG